MIIFRNDGTQIAHTNYWTSDLAKAGYAFLSYNAGAARLLLPPALAPAVEEMKLAREVILSVGHWPAKQADGVEVMFEDDSDSPWALHMSLEQCDRRLPEDNQGGGFFVSVWTEDLGEVFRLPARFRKVAQIPCLAPWQAH